VSDSRGEFAFRVPVEEMTYKLTARAAGYIPQEKTTQAAGEVRPTGAATELTALLGQCAAGLRGMSDSITHLYFSHADTRAG